MHRVLIFILLSLLSSMVFGQDTIITEENFEKKYSEFLKLYQNGENDEAFYQLANGFCTYYKQRGEIGRYYTMQLNVCLYDCDCERPYQAMKRAYSMMEEMKAGHNDYYENVYLALGTVYESRGNYRMAQYYYEQALENTDPNEPSNVMSTQARIANLLMFTKPLEAKQWNEKYFEQSESHPDYRQCYYFINGIIDLVLGDAYDFEQNYHAYHNVANVRGNYGEYPLEIAKKAFEKNYDEAIRQLEANRYDLSIVARLDMITLIYEMQGLHKKALETTRRRAELVDSLNTDLMFNNLNEINAEAGVSKAHDEASRARSSTIHWVFGLTLIIIAILGGVIAYFKKTQKELQDKNEQLRATLSMAEEGEKMKTEFVRSVSHEIRTPLNAICGFHDVLFSPDIELSDEERSDLTERIKQNVKAITDIVDEMLHMADKESNEFYPKSSRIYPNQFLSALLYEHRAHVSGAIELNYTTRVINRFQIETNEEGLRKIMEHLIQNAIKFTQKGMIEVHCEQSADHNSLLISITDTGRGISKEQQEKIFTGFYKADMFDQGIGLGLTVSKKIARKLGGDLTLDESYTNGARFVLSLPV